VATAAAAVRLELAAEDGGELRLEALNAGDETADEVVPEARYQHRSEVGETARLVPGARHEWRFALPISPGAGSLPVTIRVRYREGAAHRTVPLVTVVGAPGPIRATLEVPPVRHHASARLVLENPEARPVAGRVVFVLPEGLATEPESQPARIAPGDRVVLPLVLQNEGGLPPGRYPVFAIFEWTDGPTHEATLARANVEVVAAGPLDRARPLLVGLGALGVTVGLLALAWRASRKKR
jgi:hypothetical protein